MRLHGPTTIPTPTRRCSINCNSRCASIAAFTADIGDAKAATEPSPVWLNKNPSYASIAVHNYNLHTDEPVAA
jgi:hypothetical protein